MKALLKIGAAFCFMVAFLESVIAGVRWWRGETLLWWEWGLVGILPILVGIYLRYFSIFGCGKGKCLLPPHDHQP